MSRLSVFAFVVLFVVALAHSSSAAKWKCGKDGEKEVDDLVSLILTLGRDDRNFPTSQAELKTYCKEHNGHLKRLEEYKDQCLKERPKQIVGIVIYSIKALVNSYCKNPNTKRTKDLLASAACANKITHDYQKCQNSYIDMLNTIIPMTDSKEKLAQMCCGYITAQNCLAKTGKDKGCSEEFVDTHITYLKGHFDNAVNVICGEYNSDNDKCDKVKPVTPRKGKKIRQNKSIFNPIVTVLASL